MSVLPYDFVFGWSTGFVGTMSLSSSVLFGNPPNIKFIFEGLEDHSSFNYEDVLHSVKYRDDLWKHWTHEDEYKYVKNEFMPSMVEKRGNKSTLVDFGHHNLYFIYGLLKYFQEYPKYRVLIVRVRRERLETALSMMYCKFGRDEVEKCSDLCTQSLFRYCPMDRQKDVILKTNQRVFGTFTEFQKALWMIDEVEARWWRAIRHHRGAHTLEISWSKAWPDSFLNATKTVAGALRLDTSNIMDVQINILAESKSLTVPFDKSLHDLDRDYIHRMQYSYQPG